ncbi:MAG: F0F1 ATP synthase subunit A [Terriglobales bacterium]|jgi:F-type H+-transporting ATPase subunit a
MHEQLWFTHILNTLFAVPVTGLFHLLHVPVADAAAPITNTFAMEVLVALMLMLYAAWQRPRLSVDKPRGWQHILELSWNGISDHSEEVIGHGGSRFLPYLFTLAIFILIGNLIGLIPSLESPTAGIETTIGLAVATFLYYHAVGLRKMGLAKYAKTFLGPIWWMAPLVVVIEIISHFARILSLSVRLYANMFAGELLVTIFMALLPVLGIVFMGLHVFVAFLQAYIFLVLTMVYLAGATAEEH